MAIDAAENQDERADRREDRPANEGIGEHYSRFHRGAVADLLDAGHDDLVARREAAVDDVVVAEQLADFDRPLPGDGSALGVVSTTKQKYLPLMRVTAVSGTVRPSAVRQTIRDRDELLRPDRSAAPRGARS